MRSDGRGFVDGGRFAVIRWRDAAIVVEIVNCSFSYNFEYRKLGIRIYFITSERCFKYFLSEKTKV